MTDPQEYRERLQKLQAKVAANDLPAFLVTAQDSICYLTGLTYMPQERPFFLLVKPDIPASLLVPALEREHMASSPNVGQVTSYWDYSSPPGQGWPERLRELLNRLPQVGVEPTLPQEVMAVKLDSNVLYQHGRIVNPSDTIWRLHHGQTDLLYAYVAGWLYRG